MSTPRQPSAQPAPTLRDRIVELRRVRAAELLPHPLNWRTHPPAQRAAVGGILNEIGFADAVLARQLSDGRLQLIDGHLRTELAPEALVPVLVLDLDEREAAKLLTVLDPLTGLAETDPQNLATLLAQVETDHAAVEQLLDQLRDQVELPDPGAVPEPQIELEPLYQVVAQCRDEAQQRELYERLAAEGIRCRLLHL